MPVCRYFLTNSCRYGSKCRYEHVRDSPQYSYDSRQSGGVSILQRDSQPPPRHYQAQQENPNHNYRNDRYQYQSDKFSKRYYQHQDYNHRSPLANNAKPTSHVTEYLTMIAKEVTLVENQNLWPLTCLGIFKGHSSLPEFHDYSPEELRYEAYKATKENNFPAYVQEVKNLLDKAKNARMLYLHPNKTTESIIMHLLEECGDREDFRVSDSVLTANESQPTSNMFGRPQNPGFNSGNVFSFSNAPAFGPPPAQQNIFGNVLNQAQPNNLFGGSSFQNSGFQPSNRTSMFGNQNSDDQSMGLDMGSDFGRSEGTTGPRNCMIEPKIEDLTKQELEQYNASTFTFGSVPIIPPPEELCPK